MALYWCWSETRAVVVRLKPRSTGWRSGALGTRWPRSNWATSRATSIGACDSRAAASSVALEGPEEGLPLSSETASSDDGRELRRRRPCSCTHELPTSPCCNTPTASFPSGHRLVLLGPRDPLRGRLHRRPRRPRSRPFCTANCAHRWATCDRPAPWRRRISLRTIWRRSQGSTHLLEASDPGRRAARRVAPRCGGALLARSTKSSARRAQRSSTASSWSRGEVPGHTAAVQGLVWRGAGLDVAAAETLSAHTFATGVLGAAIRLGLLGHIAAQRILLETRAIVTELLREPAPALDALHASTPEAEIAIMRHETAVTRLFAN